MCSFESAAICGYTNQKSGDKFDWTRASGGSPSVNTGPSNDHTYGTSYGNNSVCFYCCLRCFIYILVFSSGHYMYIETSGSSPKSGDNAILSSPYYPKTTESCLEFYYHMKGKDIGTLNVYSAFFFWKTKIWSKSGNQSNIWNKALVTIKSPRFSYRVRYFELYQ